MHKNLKAALLIVVGMALISSNDAIIKINSESLGVGQILFVRGLAAVLVFSVILKVSGRDIFSSNVISKLNMLRATCECMATFCFVTSLFFLPIATASTLVWTAPIFLTISSAIFLKERVTLPRFIAVFMGFVGILLVTNPFSGEFSWPMILPLVAAGFVVARDLFTRKLDTQIHSLYVVFTTLIFVTVAGGIVSYFDWRVVEPMQLAWLSLSSLLLCFGFFFQISAIRMGELSFIAPFLFSGILVALFWGYLIWGDIPTLLMMSGVGLVMCSGIFIIVHQNKIEKKVAVVEA